LPFFQKVLLPPLALGHPDAGKDEFPVRLTKQKIQDSPDLLSDRPVSRQDETAIYGYYGWRPYWNTGFFMGGYGYVGDDWVGSDSPGSVQRERAFANDRLEDGDPHLRSAEAVTGSHIHATDGEIVHVEDLLLDDTDWSIRYFAVDTRNWWPGKHVLISPGSAGTIDWPNRLVNLNVNRRTVEGSPEYDGATTVDQAYEQRFHEYYRGARAKGLY